MRTPWDGYGSDDPLQARDPRYPIDVGPGQPKRAARALSRIAVKSVNRIVIVQVTDIVRIEAEDNYVRLWADRPYLHKETLSGLMNRLDPTMFLRVHRSHAVNISAVRELRPMLHGGDPFVGVHLHQRPAFGDAVGLDAPALGVE